MAITQTITTLPTAPSTADSSTFRARGDAFLAALNTFDDEMNLVISQANALETNVNTKEASATASAVACTASANFQGTWTNQTTVIGQSWHYQGNIYRVLVAGNTSPIASPNNWVKLWINQNRRNYLINGNFDMWQRGTSVTISVDGGLLYTADRFFSYQDGTSASITTSMVLAPLDGTLTKSRYGVRHVVVGGANTYANSIFIQRIESVRTANARKVTVSFLAKADATKNIAVKFNQNFGTGGTPSAMVNVTPQLIVLSTSLVRYSLTFDIPSISGKTIGNNFDDYLQMGIVMSSGTAGSAPGVGVQSGTFELYDIKIEDGSVATNDWHPYDGEFGGEVQACQRYYEVVTGILFSGYNITGAGFGCVIPFKDTKRAVPTVSLLVAPSFVNAATFTATPTVENFSAQALVSATGSANMGITTPAIVAFNSEL